MVVAGGGPVGLALGLALTRRGIDCIVLDARAESALRDDHRVLALSHASCTMLQRLGAWDGIEAAPIDAVHVSQQGHFGRTVIRAAELGLDALGHVVPAGMLAGVLADACRAAGVAVERGVLAGRGTLRGERIVLDCGDAGTRSAELLAWADGGSGAAGGVRVHDYGQQAIVARLVTTGGPPRTAYERFIDGGAIALLPLDGGHAAICCLPDATAPDWMTLDDTAFLDRITQSFGGRLRCAAAGPRAAFPLSLRVRRAAVAARTVWLGNAAQTLHPLAGQGFNLALRDVAELAHRLAHPAGDCGAARRLAAYAAARRLDRGGTIGFTDALVRLFAARAPALAALRGAGLLALDLLPGLRRFTARRLVFGAGNGPG